MRCSVVAALAAVVAAGCTERSAESAEPAVQPSRYVRPIPEIGARVRVIVPTLGPGWRTGVFARSIQDSTCYRVLLFDPGLQSRDAAVVSANTLVRLQVSTLYSRPDSAANPDPGASAFDGEEWLDVPLDSIAETVRHCPATNEHAAR